MKLLTVQLSLASYYFIPPYVEIVFTSTVATRDPRNVDLLYTVHEKHKWKNGCVFNTLLIL
jgi:hypothetical protein